AIRFVNRVRTPVMFIHGDNDQPVSRLRSSYAKSLDLVDDGVGRGGPDKRLALLVVIRQIRIDRRLQRRDTVERAAPNPLRGDRREEALDLVEPTRTGWREMDVIPRMPDKPARHLWRFMRAGVVHDHVHLAVGREGGVHVVEKLEQFGVAMPAM